MNLHHGYERQTQVLALEKSICKAKTIRNLKKMKIIFHFIYLIW